MIEFCVSLVNIRPYRRAAQITAIQLGHYPLKIFEVVWGNHTKDYSDSELVEMLIAHGLENHKAILDPNTDHKLTGGALSLIEANVRAFHQIRDQHINAVILEDDKILKMPYVELERKLTRLVARFVDDEGFVQLKYNPKTVHDKISSQRILPVIGAPDFTHGSIGCSQSALFVTPGGADRMLAYLAETDHYTNIEKHLPEYLYSQPWVYSVIDSESIVVNSWLQGDSIAVEKKRHSAEKVMKLIDKI